MSDYGRIGDYIGPVAAKKLSAVDIDANSSNQHEFGGNDALRRLLGTGEDRRASQGHGIPTALMYLSDDDAPAVADLETTWYDARRNNPNRSAEWRLYYKDCEPIRMARPGDLMCFGMLRDNRLLIIIAQHDSTAEAQAKWLFGIDDEQEGAFRFHDNTERELDAFGAQIFEALGINVEVRDDTYLPEMIGRWGYRFPSNEEFAAFSQSSLTDVDPTHDDPDDVVIEYYDRSYLLFKLYERAVIQHDYDAAPFVSDGVIDVDSFTSFYTSVRNRRMSRAGKVLEIHIAASSTRAASNTRRRPRRKTERNPISCSPRKPPTRIRRSPRNSCVCSPRKHPSRIVSARSPTKPTGSGTNTCSP